MRIPPASELLNDTERLIFKAVFAAGVRAGLDYARAALANSSGLRGDGEPLEKTLGPVNPYDAPPP